MWFGEGLDEDTLAEIDEWIVEGEIDLVLVIGTSSVVYPAAGYAEQARTRNTSVVTINLDADQPESLRKMRESDFAFAGDAAVLLPQLLEPVIGKPRPDGTYAEKPARKDDDE